MKCYAAVSRADPNRYIRCHLDSRIIEIGPVRGGGLHHRAAPDDAAKVAPLAVYLASDAAAGITGQIFSVRANEIFLMSQSRPLRSVHRSEGWTAVTIDEQAIPALRSGFYGLDKSANVSRGTRFEAITAA